MRIRTGLALMLLPALLGSTAMAQESDFAPVTDEVLLNPDPADWLMWRRTLNSWGHSPLDQINKDNVDDLRLVWTRGLAPGVMEGTPLVRDGRLFMPQPNDIIEAFDAATGDFVWRYQRELPADLGEYMPFTQINRNLAIYGNQIIDTSGDDFIYALDADTGQVLWETAFADYKVNPAQETAGPITVNGKIFSTRGCEPRGGPEACIVLANDATNGEELWRAHLIPSPGEAGDETWGDVPYESRWHVGAWMVPSYDPESNLLIFGTSVTSPAPKFMFGDTENKYLYHNSTIALNADTGEMVWYFQHVVDHWDLDHPFERLLVETAVAPNADAVEWINPNIEAGETRRVVTGIPGKTGIVYTLDLETGEFLWATPTVEQTVIASIDPTTGEATVNPDAVFTEVGQTARICPTTNGGKGFPAGAYSPDTNTMYYPLGNSCHETTATAAELGEGGLYAIRNANATISASGDGENVGTLRAINVETGETTWQYDQRAGMMSVVSTGGGLLFAGDSAGKFRAFDRDNGEILWEVNLGSSVTGYPVTFAVDGKQFVAVGTGSSLVSGGWNRLTPEINAGTANNLFVFALPDEE